MTLHDAIEQLLRQKGKPMTTQQIADELNKNKWYEKKDRSQITAFQIHGRTRKYEHLFSQNGSIISLVEDKKNTANSISVKKATQLKFSKTAKSNDRKTSFLPFSDSDTEILILGTMSGDKSLKLGEYYGHPRNRFWRIISTITNNTLPSSYPDKKSLLLKSKIGIWDVAHTADRKGSLDVAIKNEEPNDLSEFISRHKKLKVIAFNGTKSEKLYDKYFDRNKKVKYFSLPSSSPANTSIDMNNICKAWRQILQS
jgi:hypoxanthine-DNA glycosylase